MRIALALTLAALTCACAPPPKLNEVISDKRWGPYADCAAAYRVNAAIADPNRAASMKAMVSETADDYEKAARERYVEEVHATAEGAARDVAARVEAKIKAFTGKAREEVEKFIDACPQPD